MAKRKTHKKTRRRYYRRPRKNPTVVMRSNTPRRKRRRRGARRNPIVPTGLLQRGLSVAAGYLLAPRIAQLIPFELPIGNIGRYIKEFAVVAVGSQLVTKTLGRRYGQALFAGGVIHIGVDMLQTYVPAFGGTGVGAYFPPDRELNLLASGTAVNGGLLPAETFSAGEVERLSSRFN